MKLGIFAVCIVALLSGFGDNANGLTDLPAPDNVKLVLVGFRHANRNPGQFFKDDPNKGKWGLEGPSMLTEIGKKQAYAYGQMLRKRYDYLINKNWVPSETKAFSSSADRCQGTLQMVLAGLFPPEAYADWSDKLDWSPVSYTIDNPLLRMYNEKCPVSDDAWKAISDLKTPESEKLFNENKEMIEFVAEKTGFKPTLSDAADIVDNIEGMEIRGLKMPDWVENNKFGENIFEKVKVLSEAPQVLCSMYEPCRRTMAAYWLNHILNYIEGAANDNKTEPKMVIYATHNEIMSSLLWLLGNERPHGVYFHGSGVIEFRDSPTKAVRVLYSEPSAENPTERKNEVIKMKHCESDTSEDGWCPLSKFLDAMSGIRVSEWQTECKLPACFCGPEPGTVSKRAVRRR